MSSVKARIKSAKLAIQNKKYDEGLNQCMDILNEDPKNYNGLIFAGLCSTEVNKFKESQEYYLKAIEVDSERLLSYQGLANLYSNGKWDNTKNKEDDNLHQIEIFQKVLNSLNHANEKYVKFSIYLSKTHQRLGQFENSFTILQNLLENPDNESKLMLYKQIFMVYQELPKEFVEMYELIIKDSFLFLLNKTTSYNDLEEIYLNFLSFIFLCKLPINDSLSQLTNSLHLKFPNEVIFIKVLFLLELQNPHFDVSELKLKFKQDDNFYNLAAALSPLTDHNDSKSIINKLPNELKMLPAAQYKLCLCLHQSGNFGEVQQVAKDGLAFCEDKLNVTNPTLEYPLLPLFKQAEWILKFSLLLAKSLCKASNNNMVHIAAKTYQNLITDYRDCIEIYTGLTYAAVKTSNLSLANEAVAKGRKIYENNIDLMSWKIYLEFKTNGNTDEVIKKLMDLATQNPTKLLPTFICGKVMWESGQNYVNDKKMCFTFLVKSAKIDSQNDEIFLLLGKLYKTVLKDTTRAISCLEKAFAMNELNTEAAKVLSDIYMAEGKLNEAEMVHEKLCKNSDIGSNKWMWLRRGLIKLKNLDIKTAIKCFLSLLKQDRGDFICWECLGQAYLLRGSYSASWKAFNKAYQLEPTSLYSLYQMASISKITKNFDKAISEFICTLNLSNNYTPALKGLGESYYLKAKSVFTEGRYELGIECISSAIKYLTICGEQRNSFSCVRKIIGDCCMLATEMEKEVNVVLPKSLLGKEGDCIISKSELLNLAAHMYKQALRIDENNAASWHDLGVCYTRLSLELMDEVMAKTSVDMLKMSVQLDPENCGYWCALGVASMNSLLNEKSLSQHCFIRSIQKDVNNPIAWVNLGVLYLTNSNIELAHRAFKQAQNIEPALVNSWVGQAIVAETIGSSEAMDLYRHATELGLDAEASCEYARCVARLIIGKNSDTAQLFNENIVNMNAVHVAATHMSKICYKNDNSYWNHSVYGVLLEHLGLYATAAKSYENAVSCLQKFLKNNNLEQTVKDDLDVKVFHIMINLIKVYSKSGQHEKVSKCTAKIPMHELKLEYLFVLCEALFKAGMPQKSLDLYKRAGNICQSEKEKFLVMIAMAIILFKTGMTDQAKSLLYACFKTCVVGLHTLSALAITLKDETLIGACIKELIKTNIVHNGHCDETITTNICLLISTGALVCKKYNVGLSHIQKTLHILPNSPNTLHVLALYLKAIEFKQSDTMYNMALKSRYHLTKFYQSNLLHDISKTWMCRERQRTSIKSQKLVTYMALCTGNYSFNKMIVKDADAVRIAQKLVHMHPYFKSGLVLLQLALDSNKYVDNFVGRKSIDLNSTFPVEDEKSKAWFNDLNLWRKSNIEFVEANPTVKIVKSLHDVHVKSESILHKLDIDLIEKINDSRELLLVGCVCKNLGMLSAAIKCFKKSALNSTDSDLKHVCYLRACHVCAIGCVEIKDNIFWLSQLQNFVSELSQIKPDAQSSVLFQGILYKVQKNLRKARNVFSRVVYCEDNNGFCKTIAAVELAKVLIERNDEEDLNKLNQHLQSLNIKI